MRRRRQRERDEWVWGTGKGGKWGENELPGVVWLPLGNLNESRGYPLNAKIR